MQRVVWRSGAGEERAAKKRRCDEESDGSPPPPAAAEPAAAAPPSGVGGGTAHVHGVPKNWATSNLSSLLRRLGLRFASCRTDKGWPHGFICFGFLEDRVAAEAVLAHQRPAGAPMMLRDATLRDKAHRGEAAQRFDGGGAAAIHTAAAARGARDVRDQTCPLWRMPYDHQIAHKLRVVEASLKKLAASVRATDGGAAPPPCPLLGILRSPVLFGFRNKVEFSFGPSADGLPSVGFNVGSFADGYSHVAEPTDCPHVSPAAKLVAAAAQAFVRRGGTDSLPVWDKRSGSGFWRLLTVREGGLASCSGADWRPLLRTAASLPPPAADGAAPPAAAAAAAADGGGGGSESAWEGRPPPPAGAEVLVCAQINDEHCVNAAEVAAACAGLAAALRAAAASASPPLPLGSLLLQVHAGASNGAAEGARCCSMEGYAAAAGGGSGGGGGGGGGGDAPGEAPPHRFFLTESMCGLRFRVSPGAFFQTNTAGAEALYNLAGEWAAGGGDDTGGEGTGGGGGGGDGATAASGLDATLFDVCCGTGTIGLTLASRFARVVGVDICEARAATFVGWRAGNIAPRVSHVF